MSIDQVNNIQPQLPRIPDKEVPLIQSEDIKAILYLGLKGNVCLPAPDHEVDILI